MSWSIVSKFFRGDLDDLIEVYFHDMNNDAWEKLFTWLNGKILCLDTPFGREHSKNVDLGKYLAGEICYIATTRCTSGMSLSLSIIEQDTLLIDIEKQEIQCAEEYSLFMSSVLEIKHVINSNHYIICPEFQKEQAFIINGIAR